MRIKDISIGRQLFLWLALVFVSVLGLGFTAWHQADLLWRNTANMYEHPLKVRRAVGELESALYRMHLAMKELTQADTEKQRLAAAAAIAAEESHAGKQLRVLEERYLGPAGDIAHVRAEYERWAAVRAETLRLLRAGRVAEARFRTTPHGPGGAQRDRLMAEIRDVAEFSRNKADEFYLQARAEREKLLRVLLLTLALLVLMLAAGAYLLVRNIREPLAELTDAMQGYGQGDLGRRSGYESSNEFGEVSGFFNLLADKLQRETLAVRAASQKLSAQNAELEAQKNELEAQNDEIVEQNMELELQKRQLGEASRLKSVFLSNMSHELRTPLNSVIALAGVLVRRLKDKAPEEEYGYLGVIERNGRHLLALINDILDLSRIEAGREEVAATAFSLRELAAEVTATLAPLAAEKGIALVNSVTEGLPPLKSDLDKCRHILQNLAGNAVKFTAAGRVELSADLEGGGVAVKVSDTGIGIARDKLDLIFEEFRQADESTTRAYGGTGLGLAIAKRYATLLRGSIAVESEPGKGSVFTLRLPLAIEAGAPALSLPTLPARHKVAAPEAGRGRRILVVEDSEPALVQLRDILRGQGYEVAEARNGREALERIAAAPPDAMILDLMMPEVDGFAVLRSIRENDATSRLPVLILTAKHVTREELSFLKSNNVRQLIQKGDVNRHDLLAAVEAMLRPAPQAATPAAARPTRKKGARPIVLVVEDNPDNMLTVRALLKDTCVIVEAPDGEAALEAARRHKPDLVLMDLSLPRLDGISAFRALRREETLRHIPVVAMTARAMKGDQEEILSHGFDAYLSKPLDSELLGRTIDGMLYGAE